MNPSIDNCALPYATWLYRLHAGSIVIIRQPLFNKSESGGRTTLGAVSRISLTTIDVNGWGIFDRKTGKLNSNAVLEQPTLHNGEACSTGRHDVWPVN